MEHLSFEIICSIADGNKPETPGTFVLKHLQACRSCQTEVELQKSLMQASRRMPLIEPSSDFSQHIIDRVAPTNKRKWYEWLIQNMGNVLVMASVLGIIGYIYSISGSINFPRTELKDTGLTSEFLRILTNGSRQLVKFFTLKFPSESADNFNIHIIVLALSAIAILIFLERIIERFVRQFRL